MAIPLNVAVAGSPAGCEEAEQWCRKLLEEAEHAEHWFDAAKNNAESGWQGPAHDAFTVSVQGVPFGLGALHTDVGDQAQALGDFAAALRRVIDRMDDALDKAHGGGLEVVDQHILPPEPPPSPWEYSMVGPLDFSQPLSARAAGVHFEHDQQKQQEHNAQIGAYREKAAVFNECVEVVNNARSKEEEAHGNLTEALGSSRGREMDGFDFGVTTAAGVLDTMSNAQSERFQFLQHARTLAGRGADYTEQARSGLTDTERQRLASNAQHARVQEASARQQADGLRRFAPLPDPSHPATGPAGGGAARFLPVAGSLVTAGGEGYKVAQGQQSVGEGAARSSSSIANSWVAGKAAFKGGMVFGPKVAVLTGLGGAVTGGIFGDHVVDAFTPGAEDDLYNPVPAYEHLEY